MIPRWLKSGITIGNLDDVGWCTHCNTSWNEVEGYDIPYTAKLPLERYGFTGLMFPVCEICFKKLSIDKIFDYCKKHGDKWKGYDGKDIDMNIVRYNIERLKEKENGEK
jgi:hypothetical protein